MNAIKTKDTTRPISQALAAWTASVDAAAGIEDLVGINYAPDRYDSFHTAHPTWKLFASESSSGLRSRGIYNNNNTQCSSYDDNAAGWGATAEASWKNVNTRAWIAGEFIWTGFDYIGEPTPYTWPAKSSYFGAIDTAGFPKDVFYFYQSKWNAGGPTMVHVVPMNWTNWTAGQAVKVMVYTNADSVELFLNGVSKGSKTMTASTGHLEWSVPFATGTLEARASKGGTVVVTDKVQTAGAAAGAGAAGRPRLDRGGRARPGVRRGRRRRRKRRDRSASQQPDRLLDLRSRHHRGRRQRKRHQPRVVQGHDRGRRSAGRRWRSSSPRPPRERSR